MNPRSLRDAARETLDRELARRASIPDLAQAPPIAKTRWRDVAKPHGFAFEVEELSTGRVDRRRLRHGRVVLRAEGDAERRLVEVWVEITSTRTARARVVGSGLLVRGPWVEVEDADLARLTEAVRALVGELPAHTPPPRESWMLVARLPHGPILERTPRCLSCRRRFEGKHRLSLGWFPAGRPEAGTSAERAWDEQQIAIGLSHLECAARDEPALLSDAIARAEWAHGDPELAPFRGADAKITRGPLVRCAACKKPLARDAWRFERGDGPSPLHLECAEREAPSALERALAAAPPDYPRSSTT